MTSIRHRYLYVMSSFFPSFRQSSLMIRSFLSRGNTDKNKFIGKSFCLCVMDFLGCVYMRQVGAEKPSCGVFFFPSWKDVNTLVCLTIRNFRGMVKCFMWACSSMWAQTVVWNKNCFWGFGQKDEPILLYYQSQPQDGGRKYLSNRVCADLELGWMNRPKESLFVKTRTLTLQRQLLTIITESVRWRKPVLLTCRQNFFFFFL